MAQDVVSLLFPGDARDLLPRYREGTKRYAETGAPSPEHLVVATSDEGLMITLVWGEGIDHEQLGRHMLSSLTELGLPFPRPTHGVLVTASWAELTAR
jgi:hypothetical protein